jgi:hypothetical protein
MASVEDLQKVVLALPEVEAATHFHMASFKVRGKNFIGIEKDGVHATFALSAADVHALVQAMPDTVEAIYRFDKPIGIRARLDSLITEQLRHLVELSWRCKAPQTLVNATQLPPLAGTGPVEQH